MEINSKRSQVEQLIDKAAIAEKSEDALRFSQAACNVSNALCALCALCALRAAESPQPTK